VNWSVSSPDGSVRLEVTLDGDGRRIGGINGTDRLRTLELEPRGGFLARSARTGG
jgi:hypothetical protein